MLNVAAVPSPARGQRGKGAARGSTSPVGAAAAAGERSKEGAAAGGEAQAAQRRACARCKDRSPLCFHCKGESWLRCARCNGTGELQGTRPCWCAGGGAAGGRGAAARGRGRGRTAGGAAFSRSCSPRSGAARPDCSKCGGAGESSWSRPCGRCEGQGFWPCARCEGRGLFPCGTCGRGQCGAPRGGPRGQGGAPRGGPRPTAAEEAEPERGVTLKPCNGTELSQIAKLWEERGGSGQVTGVWSVDNPHLAWRYRQRRAELRGQLGRAPEELKGFHGTHPSNVLSIVEQGFDAGRRAGQACGSGEYFAKDPLVSVSYCQGGTYMLVCQLCLGHQSTTPENSDGDHIWVPHFCYVISQPSQVLPLYIVRFTQTGHCLGDAKLTRALSQPKYCSGGLGDERLVDLTFSEPSLSVEAFPAAWCAGDLAAFCGSVCFDPRDQQGAGPLEEKRLKGKVLLVRRGGGKFRALAAQACRAGALAMLVAQKPGEPCLLRMVGEPEAGEEPVPAAMISAEDGERLMELASSGLFELKLASASGRGAQEEELPPNRPCAMSATATDALWLGFLRAHLSDERLAADVRAFLARHCASAKVLEVRVVRGKFTQAKVSLGEPLARAEVHALNTKPFLEAGVERTLTVDDAHGSPDQRCPRSIARYCRGQSLRFADPCWCSHGPLPTAQAAFTLEALDLESAKGDEICSAFLQSAPFHCGGMPRVTRISAVKNPQLERQHEFFRRYLTQKNGGEAPRQVELYHGTNMNILETVYTHGLFPPSDMEASEDCPVSGGKGLRTSLCTNACRFCTKPHAWDRCHMFGLGVYLADQAQKSHRYVSAAVPQAGGGQEYKMVLCSVLLGDALQLAGHLKSCDSMHCVHSLRALRQGDLPRMAELVQGVGDKRPLDQKDILFVKGLGSRSRPGFSVFNSEFVSFHPYQCLPRYEIAYVV